MGRSKDLYRWRQHYIIRLIEVEPFDKFLLQTPNLYETSLDVDFLYEKLNFIFCLTFLQECQACSQQDVSDPLWILQRPFPWSKIKKLLTRC